LAVAYYNDALGSIPFKILPWLVAYEILAVVLISSIFLAIGASTGTMQEAQGMLLVVWFPMMIPFFLFTNVLMDPNGTLVTTVSLIPPLTPMMMMARMSASDAVPLWQPLLGMVLVLLLTVVCVWASSRIFRIGILSQGKAPSLVQLARWTFQGG
jgi:ABC-2 type transport system permease protein